MEILEETKRNYGKITILPISPGDFTQIFPVFIVGTLKWIILGNPQ